jgi:Metal binding domain of Ada
VVCGFLVSHGAATRTVSSVVNRYRLIGRNGLEYSSATPGTLGGHRRTKVYGRLDCPSALRWIARGHYVRYRVFFADEATAIAAGYRPCANCLPERYRDWASGR